MLMITMNGGIRSRIMRLVNLKMSKNILEILPKW